MIDKLVLQLHNPNTKWHEKARIIYEFHYSQLKENGQKSYRRDFGWSYKQTGDMLGISKSHVYNAIYAWKLIEKDPGLIKKYNSISELYMTERGFL